MGFSVSASAAIVFVGFVVAFTTFYPVAANGLERVTDARKAVDDRALDRQNTAIELATASYDGGTLTVAVNNTGTTELSVSETDLLVDNAHRTGGRAVEGDAETDVWFPGETLTITVENLPTSPERLKVVTENGVAAGGDV